MNPSHHHRARPKKLLKEDHTADFNNKKFSHDYNTWYLTSKNKAAWKILLEIRGILGVKDGCSIIERAREVIG